MTNDTPASSNAQLQACLREVEKALRGQDLPQALKLANDAVGKGIENAHLMVLAAHYQLNSGTLDRALDIAGRARAEYQHNIDVLNVYGLALARLNRGREALPVFDAALRLKPTAAVLRFNKAWTLEQLRELTRAKAEFERVLDHDPNHVDTLVHLAHLAVQRRDLKAARDYANRALKQDPRQFAAGLALANADIQDKDFAAAVPRLEALSKAANVTAINRSIALGLLGDALEGLGRTGDAFAAWTASQAVLRAFYDPIMTARGHEPSRLRALRLTGSFSKEDERFRRDAQDPYRGPVREHVFLIGFPRSGTTLLEQVLAGHPDVESLEERDCLEDSVNAFIKPLDGLDRLAASVGSELSEFRELYWKRAAKEGAALKRPVFIDKMPLNSVPLCVVARLFPQAKILFALRDPRDVVFSCFRRRFVITPQMFELTSLESAASYYDAVMQLCETYRTTLGFEFCDSRYEDLVNDFDEQCRRLCAFIGLEWNESMRDFAERARAGTINTPSAPQVARGLFTQGIGQWRAWRNELAPVLSKLAPWVARFGYSED
jgi:tetratricopeptide (TPR) repeat protein